MTVKDDGNKCDLCWAPCVKCKWGKCKCWFVKSQVIVANRLLKEWVISKDNEDDKIVSLFLIRSDIEYDEIKKLIEDDVTYDEAVEAYKERQRKIMESIEERKKMKEIKTEWCIYKPWDLWAWAKCTRCWGSRYYDKWGICPALLESN